MVEIVIMLKGFRCLLCYYSLDVYHAKKVWMFIKLKGFTIYEFFNSTIWYHLTEDILREQHILHQPTCICFRQYNMCCTKDNRHVQLTGTIENQDQHICIIALTIHAKLLITNYETILHVLFILVIIVL